MTENKDHYLNHNGWIFAGSIVILVMSAMMVWFMLNEFAHHQQLPRHEGQQVQNEAADLRILRLENRVTDVEKHHER